MNASKQTLKRHTTSFSFLQRVRLGETTCGTRIKILTEQSVIKSVFPYVIYNDVYCMEEKISVRCWHNILFYFNEIRNKKNVLYTEV